MLRTWRGGEGGGEHLKHIHNDGVRVRRAGAEGEAREVGAAAAVEAKGPGGAAGAEEHAAALRVHVVVAHAAPQRAVCGDENSPGRRIDPSDVRKRLTDGGPAVGLGRYDAICCVLGGGGRPPSVDNS